MNRQIYVAKINRIPNKEVVSFFEQYGHVERAFFPRVRLPENKSYRKNFCFITFDTEDAAKEALKGNGSKIHDNEIVVQEAQPRAQRPRNANRAKAPKGQGKGAEPKPRKEPAQRTRVEKEFPNSIYITNVPEDTDIRDIIALFNGPIRSTYITRARPAKDGFRAVVRFYNDEDAAAALEMKVVKLGGADVEIQKFTKMVTEKVPVDNSQ